jgi:flavodoxin
MSILYFSRTQKTKAVAEKLSKILELENFEIKDDKNWKGVWGFLKGGYYASTNKKVGIDYNKEALSSEHLFVLSPVWASGPAPAVRTFLNDNPDKTITLIYTCDGSSMEKIYKNSKKLFPHVKNYYGITHRLNNENAVIDKIVKDNKDKLK